MLDWCFEDDVFFEFEFLFEWLEGVFRIAACEREPLARLLAEAGWHFFMRKSGEFAESADAPERECLVVIEFEMEGADGDGCERVGFATSWNYGDAAGEFGFDAGGVEVGANGDGGAKAGCGNGVAQTVSDLIGWSEEAFGAGDVEDEGARVLGEDLFNAGGELRDGFEKYCSGCGFGLCGSGEDVDVAELFDFEAGQAGTTPRFLAWVLRAQTRSCGGEPSRMTTGAECRSGLRRRMDCAGNSGTCTAA